MTNVGQEKSRDGRRFRSGVLAVAAILGLLACAWYVRHPSGERVEDFPARSAPRYRGLVSVHWVKKLLEYQMSPEKSARPETYEANRFVILEASWGPENVADHLLVGHVPGAIHLDTDQFESGYPEWKLLEPRSIQAVIGSLGISPDTLVVVYSDKLITAARVWWVLQYAGVQDVRIMDGGIQAWRAAGFDTVRNFSKRDPVQFAAPPRLEWLATTDEVLEAVQSRRSTLADVRSEDEYAGRKSGYSYLDAKGRIPGSVHLGDADDSSKLYVQPDGRVQPPEKLITLWTKKGLRWDPTRRKFEQDVILYCGGGWRSSVGCYFAWLMGIDNVRNYSDGWCGWSTVYQRDAHAKGTTPGWKQVPTGHPVQRER